MVEFIARTYRCPSLRTQADVRHVQEVLASSPEIDDFRLDLATQSVWVVIADPVNEASFVNRMRKIEFPVEEQEDALGLASAPPDAAESERGGRTENPNAPDR